MGVSILQMLYELILALMLVEGDGVGDDGKAIGTLQIHKVVVDDVNRIIGRRHFTYEDRWCEIASKQMAGVYLSYWGQGGNQETWARLWNGGPSMNGTDNYWRKVSEHLK